MTPKIIVNFTYDPESHNYAYFCESPAMVGGAATIEEAERLAGEALGEMLGGRWVQVELESKAAQYELASANG